MTQEQYLDCFKRITEDMYETTRRKNTDYTGDSHNAFKNFTMVEELGFATAEQGFMTRMTDKIMRIAGFVKNGTLLVKDESASDTLKDLAIYSILFMLYLEEKREKCPLSVVDYPDSEEIE